MAPPKWQLGIIGAVALVHAAVSISLNHAEYSRVNRRRLARWVGATISITGLGIGMILYGLVGEYLKTRDFGILGTGAAIPLHIPHQPMIYFGALVFGEG